MSPEKFNGKSNPKETNNSTLAEEHSLSNRMRERYDGGDGMMTTDVDDDDDDDDNGGDDVDDNDEENKIK